MFPSWVFVRTPSGRNVRASDCQSSGGGRRFAGRTSSHDCAYLDCPSGKEVHAEKAKVSCGGRCRCQSPSSRTRPSPAAWTRRILCAPSATNSCLPQRPNGTPLVYLCGHSLGLQPAGARALVEQELDDWAQLGVEGHFHGQNAVVLLPRDAARRRRPAGRGVAARSRVHEQPDGQPAPVDGDVLPFQRHGVAAS